MNEQCPICAQRAEPYKVTTSAVWVRAYYKCLSCHRIWLVGWSLIRSERVVTK